MGSIYNLPSISELKQHLAKMLWLNFHDNYFNDLPKYSAGKYHTLPECG